MTNIIETWLNEKIELSKPITNFEKDFSNGYLFAELLFKMKRLPSLERFYDSNNKEEVDHNYMLLDKTFKDLNIRLSQEEMNKLKNQVKNQSKKILCMIKNKLDSSFVSLENIFLKNSNFLHQNYKTLLFPKINKRGNIQNIHDKIDILERTDDLTKKNKEKEYSLPVIDLNESEFYNKIKSEIISNNNQINEYKHSLKKEIFNKERNYHMKINEKEEKNTKNHEESMIIKSDFEKSQLKLTNQQADYLKQALLQQYEVSNKEGQLQMEVFEKNISRLGLDMSSIDPKYKKNSKITMSSEMLIQKIKEKMELKEKAKKEKERRNRKVYFEHNKAKEDLEKAIFERKLQEENFNFESNKKMNIVNSERVKYEIEGKDSSTMRQKEFEKWRYIHDREKKIFERNKNFFEKLEYSMRSQIESQSPENFQYKKSQLDKNILEFNREDFYNELHSINKDFFILELESRKERRLENSKLIKKVVDQIIDLTEEAFDYQTKEKSELIENDKWRKWMELFINNEPISDFLYFIKEKKEEEEKIEKKDPFQIELNRYGINVEGYNDIDIDLRKYLYSNDSLSIRLFSNDLCGFYDYIYYLNIWNPSISSTSKGLSYKKIDVKDIVSEKELCIILSIKYNLGTESPELTPDLEEYLTIPETNDYNYLFSEMIESLFEMKYIHFPIQSQISNFNPNLNTSVASNQQNNQILYGISSLQPPIFEYDTLFKLKSSVISSVPIKVCLIGHRFSGKKTIIKGLQEQFPFLKTYNIYENIKNWIGLLRKIETPIEADPKYKSFKKQQIDQWNKEKEQDEARISSIRHSISQLKDQIDRNERMNDEIIVDLLVNMIVNDYTNTNTTVSIDELVIKSKRKAEIQEELLKIREEMQGKKGKNRQKEEQTLINELNKLNTNTISGFIVIDFPSNLTQSRLLEKYFTNYVTELEKPVFELLKVKENLNFVFDSYIKPHYSKQTAYSSMNKIIYLDCDTEECVRRSIRRRIDPNTGNIYHLDDNPPNINDNKLMERLRSIEDKESSEDEIRRYNLEFDMEIDRMEEFYSGLRLSHMKEVKEVKEGKENLITSQLKKQVFNNESSSQQVQAYCIETISYKTQPKQVNEVNEVLNDSGEDDINTEKNIHIINKEEEEPRFKTKTEVLMEITKVIGNLIEIHEDKEKEMIKQHLLKEQNQKESVQTPINAMIKEKEKEKSILFTNNTRHLSGRFSKQLSVSAIGDEVSRRGDYENNIYNYDEEEIGFNIRLMKKIVELKKRTDSSMIEGFILRITEYEKEYSSQIKSIFAYVSKQNDYIIKNLTSFQETFIKYLSRPSNKKKLINDYKNYHNKIILDDLFHYKKNPELKSKIIENMHVKIDHLNDSIWNIIDQRKNESIEERLKIVSSGWIELEMERMYMMIERMIMIETERFFKNVGFLREYYQIIENKQLIDNTNVKYDLYLLQNLSNTILEKENFQEEHMNISNISSNQLKNKSIRGFKVNSLLESSQKVRNPSKEMVFPRLEKLYKNCIYILFKYEENMTVQKELSQIDNKKTVFKPKKVVNHTSEMNFDDRKEGFSFEEEYKLSVRLEKNKYRYRFSKVKSWGESVLKKYRQAANMVFDIMDDWIIRSVKEENDCMNTVIGLCRQGLERESTIKIDDDIDLFDIFENLNLKETLTIPYLIYKNNTVGKGGNENISNISIGNHNTISYETFSFEGVMMFYNETKQNESQTNYINDLSLLDLLLKKYLTKTNHQSMTMINSTESALRFIFKNINISYKTMSRLINSLSHNRHVNIKYFFVLLPLFEFYICPNTSINLVYHQVKSRNLLINSNKISKDTYYSTVFWYENEKGSSICYVEQEYKRLMKDYFYSLLHKADGSFCLYEFFEYIRLEPMKEVKGDGFVVDERRSYMYYLFEDY